MARIGKITVTVDESLHGHTLTVKTVGKKGKTLLNVFNLHQVYDYQNSASTAAAYWSATLTETIALL